MWEEKKGQHRRKETGINDNSYLPYMQKLKQETDSRISCKLSEFEVHHKVGNFSKEDNTISMFIITFLLQEEL